MAYSTTYDRLLTIAATALGMDRSHLGADERSRLNEVPNQAVADLAQERPWNYLQRSWMLTFASGLATYLLPVDFAQFWRPGALAYSRGSGYPQITWTDLVSIRNLRSGGAATGTPYLATIGETVSALDACSGSIGGAGTLSGVHKYRYRRIDAAGIVHWSDLGSVTHAGATANATVSGWPSEAGTVTLYRTKLGATTLYAVPGAASLDSASASSYVDSTADAALGATTFPSAPLSTETILGRQQLELYPAPLGAYILAASYRRLPATMATLTDAPDIPAALTTTLESATKIAALAKFNRAAPDALRVEYATALARAERLLADQNPGNGEPLNSIVRRMPNVPVGRQVDLKSTWGQ